MPAVIPKESELHVLICFFTLQLDDHAGDGLTSEHFSSRPDQTTAELDSSSTEEGGRNRSKQVEFPP